MYITSRMGQRRGTLAVLIFLYSCWQVGAFARPPLAFSFLRAARDPQTSRQSVIPLKDDLDPLDGNLLDALSEEIRTFPMFLQEKLGRRGITSLLPIQSASFQHVQKGNDAVLHAPTGSGKTLSYVLPLSAAAMKDASKQQKSIPRKDGPISPLIVTLLPSRELATQVGKEWTKYYPSTVITVFGGVPLERHTGLLRSRKGAAAVVVCTPGRLRALVREGHLDFRLIQTLVIDEADVLLDATDSPDVQAILEDIAEAVGNRDGDPEYQLILVSATVNQYVRDFAMNVMELSTKSKGFIQVYGSHNPIPEGRSTSGNGSQSLLDNSPPTVQHWMVPAKSQMYQVVTADLIATLSPRLSIIFVPTRSDAESVGAYLSTKLLSASTVVRVLHGDMVQSQRSRTVAMIREGEQDNLNQILVSTDVVSRGLDLPNVDLVVQHGVPRVAGREGTYSVELYTHRTGRAGRARVERLQRHPRTIANSVLLYDAACGEGKLVKEMAVHVKESLGVEISYRPIPSTTDLLDAGYERAMRSLQGNNETALGTDSLVAYMRTRLMTDSGINVTDTDELLTHLCSAMVALSKIDQTISPTEPRGSFLTGDPSYRTLLVYRDDGEVVTPAEVTKVCKSLGSGKLGRILVTKHGQAVLDLPEKRAKKLLQEASASDPGQLGGWIFELCERSSLPEFA